MRHATLLLILLCFGAGPAQPQTLEGRVRLHRLANGMTFLLLERHQSPTIAFSMRFRAGNVDEFDGINGTAHLLEHMLFKGTRTLGTRDFEKERVLLDELDATGEALDAERLRREAADPGKVAELEAKLKKLSEEARKLVIKDEIDEIYSKAGGVGFNASTNRDLTTYVVSLPSNRLELWARIEADRMANPVLREYWSERNVIMEERRMRTDSDPSGALWEQFTASAFLAHRYAVPVIGWMSEIQFLSKNRTEEFRRTHYAPNNTVAAVVGDFDTARTIPVLERYFGAIPTQPLPRPLPCVEPEQIGERRVLVEQDANPLVLVGYHKPNLPHRDDYVFDAISALLTDGRSSRLYKKLVKELQIAVSVDTSGSYPGNRYPNLFVLSAVPRAPHAPAQVEQVVYAELERLKREPVGEKELGKVFNQLEADFIRGLDSNAGLAGQLSVYQSLIGDWRYVERHPKVIRTITPAEIQKVATRYFTASNRTVATLVKKSKPGQAGEGASAGPQVGPARAPSPSPAPTAAPAAPGKPAGPASPAPLPSPSTAPGVR